MVRVAHCIDTLQVGGTELNAIRTLERLDRDRVQLSVAHFHGNGPLLERYLALGVPLRRIDLGGHLLSTSACRGVLTLAAFLRREKADVVHAHDIYSNVIAVPAARLAGTRVVVASRRWWDDSPRRGLNGLNRIAYRFATHVLANSESVGRLLVEREGVPERKLLTLPNFVSDEAFEHLSADAQAELRQGLGIPTNALVIGTVARLAPVKGQDVLIEAFRRLAVRFPVAHLVLVGDGPARAALEALVAAAGLGGRVHFAGTRPQHPNLHQLFDVSVLPSLSEGFPNSVVEAMAAGRPVVASDVGGVADAVRPGETGLLVPARDAGALAAALEELLADPARRAAMGRRGAEVARERYAAAPVIERLTRWYEGTARRA